MAEVDLDPNFRYRQAAQNTFFTGMQLGASIAERRQMMELRRRELEQNIAKNIIQQNLQQAQADMYRQRTADEFAESEAMKRDAPKMGQYQSAYRRWLQNPDEPLPEPPPMESRQNQTLINGLLTQADQYSARAQRMKAEEKAAAAMERMEAEMLNDAVRLGATVRDQNGRIVINQVLYNERKQKEVEANLKRDERLAAPTQGFMDALSRSVSMLNAAVDAGESPDRIQSLRSAVETTARQKGSTVRYNESGYAELVEGIPQTLRPKYVEAIDKSNKAIAAIDEIENLIPQAFGVRAAGRELGQRMGLAQIGMGRTEEQTKVAQRLSQLTAFAARALLDEKGAMSNYDIERARELAGQDFLRSSPEQAKQRLATLREMFAEAKSVAESRLGGGGQQAQENALDAATARQILQEAGGDKERARALARERGYKF